MCTKEFLKRAFTLNTAINSKMERIAKLRSMAESIGYEREELKMKLLHMERDLDSEIDRLIRQQTLIERMIEAIPDERGRTLLELRYLNRLSWEEIGLRMYLDVRWAQRLHDRALALLRIPSAEMDAFYLDEEEEEVDA